eukprot:gene5979-6675_t
MSISKIDVFLWLRGQFRLVKFGFSYASRSDFTNPKWSCFPRILLVIFRSICALYTVAFAVATLLESTASRLSQLPFAAQALGATYFFISAISAEVSFFRKIRRFSTHRETFFQSTKKKMMKRSRTMETISDAEQGDLFQSETDIPERLIEMSLQPVFREDPPSPCEGGKIMNLFWYHKLQWVIYDISLNLCLTFTMFALIYESDEIFKGKIHGRLLRLHTYAITSVLLIIELLINNMPVRVLHFVYPFAVSLIYFIISLVSTLCYRHDVKLFPEMNCSGLHCLEQTSIALGLGSPLVHAILCVVYCVKNRIAACCLTRKQNRDQKDTQLPARFRKVSRASRASDSTAVTVLDGYKTYAVK